ncbi:hypothetical protein HHI36_023463 [Cryptolaemus montrouzieri]|uniref:Myb-like domain-containing protein n=1 Tax=Cryptolaemus montrouzieri TaxID=559131 RepID=A0ABD2PHA3_9CUCU
MQRKSLRPFSEYEDVFLLVNYVLSRGDFDVVEVCFEKTRSKQVLKKRYESCVRFCPFKIGNWSRYEDDLIKFWGDVSPFLNPWGKLAMRFRRRPKDIRERYKKINRQCKLHHGSLSERAKQIFQRGVRVRDVSFYILTNDIVPTTRIVKKLVDIRTAIDTSFSKSSRIRSICG